MTWLIYDFFDPATASQTWRGSAGLAPPHFVKALAVDLPQNFSSIKCNEWSGDDYIGGLRVCERQTCVFRICNGGRDHRGRPHRWVLLVALTDSETWRGTDVFSAVESPMFSAYAIAPVASPAPLPTADPAWPLVPAGEVRATPDNFTAEGNEAKSRARDCSLRLTTGGATAGLLIVQKQAGQVKTWFKLEGEKYVPPTRVEVRQPAKAAESFRDEVLANPVSRAYPDRAHLSHRLKWYFLVIGLLVGIMLGLAVGKFLWDKPPTEPAPGRPGRVQPGVPVQTKQPEPASVGTFPATSRAAPTTTTVSR